MSSHKKKTPQPAAPRSTTATTPPAAPKPARKPKSPAKPSKVIFTSLVTGALKKLTRAGDMRPTKSLAEHMDKICGALEFVIEEAKAIPEDWKRGMKARALTPEQIAKLEEQAAKIAAKMAGNAAKLEAQQRAIAERLALAMGGVAPAEIDPSQMVLPAVEQINTAGLSA